MDEIAQKTLRFEKFTLDVPRRSLCKGDREVDLRPKSLDVLIYMVANAGRLVTKDEIIGAVWPNVTVTDESLTRCVSDVRLALEDSEQRIIKTIPRRGYFFTSALSRTSVEASPPRDRFPGDLPAPGLAGIACSNAKLWARFIMLTVGSCLLMAIGFGVWSGRQSINMSASDQPAIAVLPFINLGENPHQEYFSDGISEDITTSLSKLSGIVVIAPSSAFKFKGQQIDVKQVGRELGARYLLQGSVRKDSERLRITTQLIDAAAGVQLWADRYDEEPGGLFSVQDDVTLKIVNALGAHIKKSELNRTLRKRPESLDAYDHVLRANALMKNAFTERRGENIAEARALYERAIATSARYAPALEGLANTYLWAWLEPTPDHPLGREFQQQATLDHAQTLSRRAIELDDTLAEARATLGWILYWQHGPTEGIAEFERAFTLNPSLVDGRFGLLLSHGGRAPEAIEYMKRAMRLDPLHSPRFLYLLGKGYFFIGRYEEAIGLVRSAAARMPGHRPSRALLAAVAAHLGRTEEAHAAATEVMRIHPEFTIAGWMKFMKISNQGYAERLAEGLRKAGLPM